ncbi:MAG: hypothetical protein R6X31_15120 [Anaerolineae bacterium]
MTTTEETVLSTNIGADHYLLSALARLPFCGWPLTSVHILRVNLVTDGILDITIALEPNEGATIVLVSSKGFVADEVKKRIVPTLTV